MIEKALSDGDSRVVEATKELLEKERKSKLEAAVSKAETAINSAKAESRVDNAPGVD